MRFIVIVGNVVLNAFIQFKTIICRVQKDIIVFDGLPESLDPHIIQRPTFAIHGDPDTQALEILLSQGTRVLRSLIGIDDLRDAMRGYRLFQHALAPLGA